MTKSAFLIVTLLIVAFCAKTQPANDTTYITTTQLYNDVKSTITQLSEVLKVGSEHVYKVLLKQQLIKSVVYSIISLIGIILLVNFVIALKNDKEDWLNTHNYLNATGGLRICQGIIATMILMACFTSTNTIVTGFINPEYGAIKDILNFKR